MEDIFVALLSMLLVLAIVPLYIWKRRLNSRPPEQPSQEELQTRETETVVRASGARRMRRRPAASGASTSAAATAVEETAGESDDEAAGDERYVAKASKKKEKKRQEREEQRQAEEAARDSRRTKQDRYEEMRRRKDEEREAQERMLEEEAKAQKAKEEEAAALEFEKWKGEFTVDAEGTTENVMQDEGQDLLSDFVEYIKISARPFLTKRIVKQKDLAKRCTLSPHSENHKCIALEDLAAEFKLRTQDCINRITSLESIGRLSGVMDDRGKYIYISLEEMKAVADYIKREGRVSISHLASRSNQFIDLEPKSHLVEDIGSVEEISVG